MTTTIKQIFKEHKYPDFIKNHEIFKKTDSVQKIFPLIGLENCQEDIAIDNSAEIILLAEVLISNIVAELDRYKIHRIIVHLADAIRNYKSCIINNNGKITLSLPYDVVIDKKTIFKKGEGLFKVYNKLSKAVAQDITLPKIETFVSFKAFSSANIPSKAHKLVFSSDGVDGIWDIATMSMRGISSCQSWTSSNSKHLIGSILDPFTGILYITSGSKFGDVGTKMVRRCLVRLVVNARQKETLLLERMYPSWDKNIADYFKNFLIRKTNQKYKVVDTTDVNSRISGATHFSPCSNSIRALPIGNRPYCDSQIEYKTDKHDIHGVKKEQIAAYMDKFPASMALKVLALFKAVPKKKLSVKQQETLALITGAHSIHDLSFVIYNELVLLIKSDIQKIVITHSDNTEEYVEAFVEAVLYELDEKLLQWTKNAITKSLANYGHSKSMIPNETMSLLCEKVVKQATSDITSTFFDDKAIKKKRITKSPLYLKLLSY